MKSSKKWLVISLIVLFNITNFGLAQSGCVVVTVKYQDGCPRSGASVSKIDPPPTQGLGTTDASGVMINCGGLGQGSYLIQAAYGGQFGPNTALSVNANGDGSATITKNTDLCPGQHCCASDPGQCHDCCSNADCNQDYVCDNYVCRSKTCTELGGTCVADSNECTILGLCKCRMASLIPVQGIYAPVAGCPNSKPRCCYSEFGEFAQTCTSDTECRTGPNGIYGACCIQGLTSKCCVPPDTCGCGVTTTTTVRITTTTRQISTTTTTRSTTTRSTTTTKPDTKEGGCPILKVWDGEKFVEIEKLNIHAPENQDVTVNSSFTMRPKNGKYEIILHEAAYLYWDGSHIDYVKLTDETGKECRLISAVHSQVGDVSQQLVKTDGVRVRTFPGEEIKLTYDGCSGNIFTFSIEGFNMKWVGMELNSSNVVMIIIALIILSVVLLIFSLIPRFLYRESRDIDF